MAALSLGAFLSLALSMLTLKLFAADGGGRAAGAGASCLTVRGAVRRAARGTEEQCVIKTPLRFIHVSQSFINLHSHGRWQNVADLNFHTRLHGGGGSVFEVISDRLASTDETKTVARALELHDLASDLRCVGCRFWRSTRSTRSSWGSRTCAARTPSSPSR